MVFKSSSLTPLVVAQLSNQYFAATTANVLAVKLAFPEESSVTVTKLVLHDTVAPAVSPVEIVTALSSAGMDLPTEHPYFVQVGFKPDFFVRDNLGDTGDVPTIGTFWNSPDILCSKVRLSDPGQGFSNRKKCYGHKPSRQVKANYYVRVQNVGTMSGTPVAYLFWAEQSTFVSPLSWAPMGTIPFAKPLLPGDTQIGPPLQFTLPPDCSIDDICVVAFVENNLDPEEIPAVFNTYAEFSNWVTGSNNVAMKNENQLKVYLPKRTKPFPRNVTFEPQEIRLPRFFMRGTGNLADRFGLTAATNLPVGSRFRVRLDGHKSVIWLVNGGVQMLFSGIKFRRNQKMHVEVEVDLPFGVAPGNYYVDIRQMAESITLGGITTYLAITNSKPKDDD